MDLTLDRKQFREDGIFGELLDHNGIFLCVTLEHSYPCEKGFMPKLPPGEYDCIRHAPNHLPYETFMIADVPDFLGVPVTGILFHILNFNKESDGCVGVGEQIGHQSNGGLMIMASAKAFAALMGVQKGVDKFKLKVSECL